MMSGSADKNVKDIANSQRAISADLYKHSLEALKKPQLEKLTYKEALALIKQTEETVQQIDISLATYGYSFLPEIHKEILILREKLDNAVEANPHLIGIRLSAVSSRANNKLLKVEVSAMQKLINELIAVINDYKN
jgi:hypothetical protein